jgi:hypothetical protein
MKIRVQAVGERHPDQDSGAVLIWVALMMVVLLGIGALVIDFGRIRVEDRQLQNGADAAALAVAQDCAGGECANELATAETYADLNAGDDASGVETVCGDDPGLSPCDQDPPAIPAGASGWVRVGTRTETPDGGDEVRFLLAPIMGAVAGTTRHQDAVAAWGTPKSAATLPFTFAKCFYDYLVETGDATVIIYSKMANNSEPMCPTGPSGGTPVPGGFGWLSVEDRVECRTEDLDVGSGITLQGDPGANPELQKCDGGQSLIRPVAGVNKIVAIPLYGSAQGQGAPATYTVVGFAGFEIQSYNLGGQYRYPQGWTCPGGASARCIEGKFVDVVVGDGEIGDTQDFGARVIQMVG